MPQEIQTQLNRVSFSDGRIEQVHLVGSQALLVFRDWQEQIWHLQFDGVVYFQSCEFAGDISEVQISSGSILVEKAVAAIERDGGRRKGYPELTGVSYLAEQPVVALVGQTLVVTQVPEVREAPPEHLSGLRV